MGWGERIAGFPLGRLATPLAVVPSVFFACNIFVSLFKLRWRLSLVLKYVSFRQQKDGLLFSDPIYPFVPFIEWCVLTPVIC